MTLVSLPSPIAYPGICGYTAGGPFLQTATTLTSAGHYLAYIFSAREDMTISHVGIRAGTSAGSPTLTVSIEGVTAATGIPDGAATYGGSAGTTGTITSNSSVLQALGGSATVPKGSVFAVKIALASGTSQVLQNTGNLNLPQQTNLPYQVINTGTPTKSSITGSVATVATGSSSTTFYQLSGAIPLSAAGAGTFNNTSAAKRGLRFTPPMKCRAIGLKWFNGSAVGDFNAAIYDDTTGTAVEFGSTSTAFEGDDSGASANAVTFVYFDNVATLNAGTTYRIAIEPSSATNVNVSTLTLVSASYRGASPAGTTAHYTTFVTGGWTDTATDQLPLMDLLIDQVDDGTGSGGGGVIGVIGG